MPASISDCGIRNEFKVEFVIPDVVERLETNLRVRSDFDNRVKSIDGTNIAAILNTPTIVRYNVSSITSSLPLRLIFSLR